MSCNNDPLGSQSNNHGCAGAQCQPCPASSIVVSATYNGASLPTYSAGVRGDFVPTAYSYSGYVGSSQEGVDKCALDCASFSDFECRALIVNGNGDCYLKDGAIGFNTTFGGDCAAPETEANKYVDVTFVQSPCSTDPGRDLSGDVNNCGACGVQCNNDPLGSESRNHVCAGGQCQPCPASSVGVSATYNGFSLPMFSAGIRGDFVPTNYQPLGNVGRSQDGVDLCAYYCATYTDFTCRAFFLGNDGSCYLKDGAIGFNTTRGGVCTGTESEDVNTSNYKFGDVTFVVL